MISKKAFNIWITIIFLCLSYIVHGQQDTLFSNRNFQKMIGKHPQDPVKPEFYINSRNNDFQLGIGGFVKLNGLFDFVALDNTKSFVTEEIPVGKNNIKDEHLNADIDQSRFFLQVLGNTPYGEMKVYFECDFTKPTGIVNIRHAYGYFKGFLIGKTSSTLMDLESIPITVDAEGPNSMTFSKNIMVRYSYNPTKNLFFNLAAEVCQPKATYSNYTKSLYQNLPDAVFQLKYKNDKAHLTLGGIYRNFSYHDTLNQTERLKNGWGLTFGGSYKLSRSVCFKIQGTYGSGMAGYIHDFYKTERDFVPSPHYNGKLVPVPVGGGYGSLEFQWTKKTKSSFIYSYLSAGNVGYKPPTSYRSGHYLSGNYLWYILPNLELAAELLYGRRINEDRTSGHATRLNFMAKFDF